MKKMTCDLFYIYFILSFFHNTNRKHSKIWCSDLKHLISLQFSRPVGSNSFSLHGLQHTRPPCPSLIFQSFLKLKFIELVMASKQLILCRPFLLLPSIFPSIWVFCNESVLCIKWPKYWSFSFSISPSNEYSGLISFRIDWLNLFAVQELSRVSSNTTVQKHQFFCAQLSSLSNSHIHTWLLEKP